MKHSILIVTIITFLGSCISTKKINNIIEPKFKQEKEIESPSYFSLDLNELPNTGNNVVSTKLNSHFIPAVFYWEWENTIKCEINPRLVGKTFKENISELATLMKLQDKLKGRKLELKLEKIANSFIYTHKGNSLVLIFAYVVNDMEAILPQKQNLTVSYKITQEDLTTKEGVITIVNKDQPIENEWKSTKKFTSIYADNLKQNTKNMAKEFLDKLLIEL